MTAQNAPSEDRSVDLTEEQTTPIGPISVPKRSLIGARAYALVGTASAIAFGVNAIGGPDTGTLLTVSVAPR